jgi:GH15 family glucan-1,4-alpha-glucosidase
MSGAAEVPAIGDAVRPWLRRAASDAFTAIGGDDGLLVWSDGKIGVQREALLAGAQIHAGERLRLLIRFVRPHLLEDERTTLDAEQVDARLAETVSWWRAWRERVRRDGPDHGAVVRSALMRLAQECSRKAPTGHWEKAREQIRAAIEDRGYDERRGVFVQCFDEMALDAALLLLPVVGFVPFDDERMVHTTDAVREELEANGFLYRYRENDELCGQEGAFLACSFWLVECYARQGRVAQAREVFDRAVGAASPLGLFSEQIDPDSGELLGNFPQMLTHLSHVAAAVALADTGDRDVAAPV